MKTIEVTDEMFSFLMTLSRELNTQSNRGTAAPYFFQVMSDEDISVAEGQGEEVWYCDGELLSTEEDIRDVIFEYYDWDLENEEHVRLYEKLGWIDKEEVLEHNYRKVYTSTQQVFSNAFLTEKACEQHIKQNSYHYSNPASYLTYAFRNPELEQVLSFLRSLTDSASNSSAKQKK